MRNILTGAELDKGNPGVGGTQYLFMLTVKYLNKIMSSNYALLLSDGDFALNDKEVPTDYVEDVQGAIRFCQTKHIEFLVINANELDRYGTDTWRTNVRIFVWAHNTLDWKRQCVAAEHDSIDKVVCVSEAQYINMKDTPCYEKCTYVNNVFSGSFYRDASLTDYSEQKAVYVGSIMPQKGVHNLLEIWKYVEKELPKAQLYIYGGANTWNPDAQLGSIGIGDVYYDRIIERRLDQLMHPENIHFMGSKGWDIIDGQITTARVGIVNPSHYMRDETFCLAAVEMEAHGIPIVSRQRHDGLATAIQDGETGYLEKKDVDIASRIVCFLKDFDLANTMGKKARCFVEKFVVENEVGKWIDLCEMPKKKTSSSIRKKKSKDARLLQHDMILKVGYTIESGKYIDLIKKRLKR